MNTKYIESFPYKAGELNGIIRNMIDTKENYSLVLNSTDYYKDTNRFMAIDYKDSSKYLCTIESPDCSFDNQFFSVSFKYFMFHPIGFSLRSSKEASLSLQKFSFYASRDYVHWRLLYRKNEDDDSLTNAKIFSSKVTTSGSYKHFLIKMDGQTKDANIPRRCKLRLTGFDLFGTSLYVNQCTRFHSCSNMLKTRLSLITLILSI